MSWLHVALPTPSDASEDEPPSVAHPRDARAFFLAHRVASEDGGGSQLHLDLPLQPPSFTRLRAVPRRVGLENHDSSDSSRAASRSWLCERLPSSECGALRVEAYPRHSMYAIYAYINPPNHPNVGIYRWSWGSM